MFNLAGNRLAATYFGGTSNDNCYSMCQDLQGNIYITGVTTSTDSMATPGAHLTTFAGGQDIFLAKFCMLAKPAVSPAGTTYLCFGDSLILATPSGNFSYLWNNTSTNDSMIVANTTSTGTYYFYVSISDGFGCTANSDSSIVVIDYCIGVSSAEECEIKSFPNPAETFLELRFCNEAYRTLVLYSVTGEKLIVTTSQEKNTSFILPNLATGVYVLKVEEAGKNFFRRIVIR